MSNELTTQTGENAAPTNPFGRMMAPAGGNAGAIAIESERAIAEAQGQLVLAKKFPRSMAAATADLMEACKSPEFAASAFYTVPNRGSGPSIRFAEEVARVYGNFQYGHRELSRSEGKSEVEVYAWDMEKNNYSKRQITVLHVLDTKNGSRRLTDQADIDNRIANVASKQMRGRILALVPKHLVAAGIAECKKTLAGNNDKPISHRVRDMIGAFSRYGVTVEQLEKYLGHKLDDTTLDELVDLTGVFNAIKDGAKPSDYLSNTEETAATGAAITNKARTAAGKTPPPGDAAGVEKNSKDKQGDGRPAKESPTQSSDKTPAPHQEEGAPQNSAPPTDGDGDDIF